MKGFEQKLIRFMEGSSKRFIIPTYQRCYSWDIEQCVQFYDDLIYVFKNKRKTHFFGSIVSTQNDIGRQEEYLIIDGQQRITTVSLLFLAIYNLIDNNIIAPVNLSIKNCIYEDYLVDKHENEQPKIKLKDIKNDRKAFNSLFVNEYDNFENSNLVINYKYFYDRIQKNEISIDDLFDSICKLQIINISLSSEDSQQSIFESLNSNRLDLTEADKIRNYVLTDLDSNTQDLFYNRYWSKIEENTLYDVGRFIKDYLCLKQYTIPNIKNLYFDFKNFVEIRRYLNKEDILKDLLKYSKIYSILLKADTKSTELNNCIERINLLEAHYTNPFLIEVINLYQKNVISLNENIEIFSIIESYIFRRIICDYPNNLLNKVFLNLHKEIFRYDGTLFNYVEKFKYALNTKLKKYIFPNDVDFVYEFSNCNVYKMKSKIKKYIFERFENVDTLEQKNIWKLIENGIYTIEHIMPQKLSLEWIEMLGDNYMHIHKKWLHKIANLTLTAYNSRYSNNSFEFKRDTKNGFKDSGIRINQKIAQCLKWTEYELEYRNNYLMECAIKIWKYCCSDYIFYESDMDIFTLDEYEKISYRHIKKFILFGEEYYVNNWFDAYMSILDILHKKNKTILNRIANKDVNYNKFNLYGQIKNTISEHEINKYKKIDENIYINKNISTSYKIVLLNKFFNIYEIDTTELVFYLEKQK